MVVTIEDIYLYFATLRQLSLSPHIDTCSLSLSPIGTFSISPLGKLSLSYTNKRIWFLSHNFETSFPPLLFRLFPFLKTHTHTLTITLSLNITQASISCTTCALSLPPQHRPLVGGLNGSSLSPTLCIGYHRLPASLSLNGVNIKMT